MGTLLFTHPPLHLIGAAIALVGTLAALAAQLNMGASWRVGVNEDDRTALVTEGFFRWIRNPIFSFIGLSVLGLVLLLPSPITLAATLLVLIGVELQVRTVEEPYLLRVHGDRYLDYASRVGRFFPGLGFLSAR